MNRGQTRLIRVFGDKLKLNAFHGLFRVSDRIFQVRGYDLANMTLIEGDTGWIIVDPLTSTETVRAAMNLVESILGFGL